ncbi:MAG: hypothetical protein ACRYHQ_02095 [Janthinobacterium lividum]
MNINTGNLAGSYGNAAAMLDEVADTSGCGGVLLTSDGFVTAVDVFGRRKQPLLRSCRHMDACAATLEPAP